MLGPGRSEFERESPVLPQLSVVLTIQQLTGAVRCLGPITQNHLVMAMADVFISYARPNRAQAEHVAAMLRRNGLSVWYDTSLILGERFDEAITRELDKAQSVIVIWTSDSVKSPWVYAEATRALERRLLFPVRDESIDVRDLPLPFNGLHTELVYNSAALLSAIQQAKGRTGAKPLAPSQATRSGFGNQVQDIVAPMAAAAVFRAHLSGTNTPIELGALVLEGDTLLNMEVMQLQVPIEAPRDAIVTEVFVLDGQEVAKGQTLMTIEPVADLGKLSNAVVSPMSGIAHRSRQETSKPLVEIGSVVKPGDPLLMISRYEADWGDVYEEIPANRHGVVRRILFKDGDSVGYGDVLLVVI